MTDKGDATTAVAPQKLLRFQRKIVTELTQPAPLNDGLVVVAKGLGLSGLLLTFVALHADPRALVLLLNTTPGEVEFLKRDLQALGKADMVNSINNETPAPQRCPLRVSMSSLQFLRSNAEFKST